MVKLKVKLMLKEIDWVIQMEILKVKLKQMVID